MNAEGSGNTESQAASKWGDTYRKGDVIQTSVKTNNEKRRDTARIPNDDSKPQIGEGTEFLNISITPTAANSLIVVDVIAYLSSASSSNSSTIALFNTNVSATDAVAVGGGSSDNGRVQTVCLRYTALASELNGVNSTTFRARFGGETDTTLNGIGGSDARVYGGALISSITVTEIKQ
jgi:hypothetical protein